MAIESEAQTLSTIRTSLALLLANSDFLPDGGLLAFGLAYEYPFDCESTQLSDLAKRLTGVDTLLKRVCDGLGLHASLKAVYDDAGDEYSRGQNAFVDYFVELADEEGKELTLLKYTCQTGRTDHHDTDVHHCLDELDTVDEASNGELGDGAIPAD